MNEKHLRQQDGRHNLVERVNQRNVGRSRAMALTDRPPRLSIVSESNHWLPMTGETITFSRDAKANIFPKGNPSRERLAFTIVSTLFQAKEELWGSARW